MELIEIDDTTYGFARNFKHDQDLRRSFNKLTETVFGFSLESWYQEGFWADYYIPYSLIHNNEVISNVSVSRIDFLFENERKTGIQIGTVMTSEKYRHKGLSKFLMKQVINEWKEKSDFIYLFANDDVLDFYPKFNFEMMDEYQYAKTVDNSDTPSSLKRLRMEDENDKSLLMETVNRSIPISKISMRNNTGLIMFYCLSYKKNCIFYIEDINSIVIADFKDDTLFLDDVFSMDPIELDDVIQAISGVGIKKVVLGFTPLNETNYDKSPLKGGDTLFVLKDKTSHFKDNHLMFPVLSHA